VRVVFLKNFRGYRKAEAADVPAAQAAAWAEAGLVRPERQAALFGDQVAGDVRRAESPRPPAREAAR
jgi:hypothetical protein